MMHNLMKRGRFAVVSSSYAELSTLFWRVSWHLPTENLASEASGPKANFSAVSDNLSDKKGVDNCRNVACPTGMFTIVRTYLMKL